MISLISEVQARFDTRGAGATLTLLCVVQILAFCVYMDEYPVGADDSVIIVNSGSTNTNGFRIVVKRSGDAKLTPERRGALARIGPKKQPMRRKIPAALVHALYLDLDAAKPLSSLPRPRCFKSASFGVRLTIKLGAEETPDLSCGDAGDAKLASLVRDANQIVNLFKVK